MKPVSILFAAAALAFPVMAGPATACDFHSAMSGTTAAASSQLEVAQMQSGSQELKERERQRSARPEKYDEQRQANPTGPASTGPNVVHQPQSSPTDGSRPEVTDQKVTNPSVR